MTTLLDPRDDIRRREFIIGGLSIAALLTGCGSDDEDSATTDAATTRMITDSRGPAEVPVAPQRIAALVGSAEIDVMLLGLEPVFSGTYAQGWVDLPEGIVTSDTVPPSTEAVASADPDLLIGWHWLSQDPAWVGLGQIAPAVTLPDEGSDWRSVFRLVADAVDRVDAAEEVLANFDERVAALRSAIAERPPITIALIGSFEPGAFWWWEPGYECNQHLQSVGIGVDGPAERGRDLSYERLGEVTAPWIILTGVPGSPDGTDDLTSNPLWAQLPAVKNDQVLVVDRDLWGGAGVMWARALLADIERLFIGG